MGVGVTHYPPLISRDEDRRYPLHFTLQRDERVPEAMKDPASWPEAMRVEYGDDRGLASAGVHRRRLVEGFRQVRAEIDSFNPDFVLIWGDDQYENFREDIIPPFCILGYEAAECAPFSAGHWGSEGNVWGEGPETVFKYRGQPQAARFLAGRLIEQGIDMAYAYRPLHHPGLAHAFMNTLLYLDYDRVGFDYPILPFAVNCYGSAVISNRGGILPYTVDGQTLPPDPPGPSPKRCLEVGAATARALLDSPWRVALIASSSWSHAFLTAKNHWLWPDQDSDRARLEELRSGNYAAWAKQTTGSFEAAGQHELLNWACLLGAMNEMGSKPRIIDWIETNVFTSDKCLAVFKP